MKWTDAHDVMLCREISLMRPYSFKPGTKESGSAWFSVASDLNTVQELKFTVNQKSVRDRTKLLLENYNTRMGNRNMHLDRMITLVKLGKETALFLN